MKSIIIRKPILKDLDALVCLMNQYGYPIEKKEMKKNLLYYSKLSLQKAFIAEKNKKVIGCVAVAITNYFHRKGRFLRVIALVVDQNHRREGIGKKLIQKAEELAHKMKCSHIELTSGAHRSGSHDFYKAIGFTDLGEIKKYFGKKLTKETF